MPHPAGTTHWLWPAWIAGTAVWLVLAFTGTSLAFGGLIAIAFALAQTLQSMMISRGRHPVIAMARNHSAPQLAAAARWITLVSGTLIWIAVAVYERPVTAPRIAAVAVAAILTLLPTLRSQPLEA